MPLLPYPLNQGLAFVESKTTRWESVVFIVVYACLFRVSCELCYNIHFLAILKEFPALVYISTASSNFAVPPKNEKPPFRRLSAFSINSSPLSSAIVVVDDRHWGAGVLTVTFDTLTLPRRQAHDLSFCRGEFFAENLRKFREFECAKFDIFGCHTQDTQQVGWYGYGLTETMLRRYHSLK